MLKDLFLLLKDLKKIKKHLLIKRLKTFEKSFDRLVIDTKLQDTNLFIKELEKILKKGGKT